MNGAASRVRDQAEQERFDELFSGQVRTRQGQEQEEVEGICKIHISALMTWRCLKAVVTTGLNEMTGLGENEQLRGFNMQSDVRRCSFTSTRRLRRLIKTQGR